MKKKFKLISLIILLIVSIEILTFAVSETILINNETFSIINKKDKIYSIFDDYYNISNSNGDEKSQIKQSIIELTKKTTYLLLGEANMQNESSESYFKRHEDYLKLKYTPEIPKDSSTYTGLDENSQEYKDDILSGFSVPGMFKILNELEIKYNSYGDIRVSIIDDTNVISTIKLQNVEMKEQNGIEPMKYDIVKSDLTIYYYFKKLNDEYKLLYLYGETNDNIEEYMDENDETRGELSKTAEYVSELKNLYDFSKANDITDEYLQELYNENKSKIVFLNSTYNTGNIASANGFFINNGIIVTTCNYIEKSLMKAQNIIISDSDGNVYELDGIVTMNLENDIAILKVKEQNQNNVIIENEIPLQKEDAVITLGSRLGVGLKASKGIVTAMDNDIQISIPISEELQGSPVFNSTGNVIGILNSKLLDSSVAYCTNSNILVEYFTKLSSKKYEEIKSIPFNEIKEKYYIKYNEEKNVNDIPKNKWNEFLKVENVEDSIELKLVKASYKDGIISLRYKNEIPNYIDTMQFAIKYEKSLKNKGYRETSISDSKNIYENEKYKIIVMKEFDYLIIIMVKL